MTNTDSTKELTLTRIFNAPRELVWQAWTEQRHIVAWWAPKGFTNPVCEWNAKPGDNILIHMQAPDGTIYPMDGSFTELIKPEKIVFKTAALDKEGKRLFEQINTVTLTEQGENTKLTLHVSFSKIKPEAEHYLDGAPTGWAQSLDKLAELLKKIS